MKFNFWFVSRPDNEQPFRKRKYYRSGHPLIYLAETSPLPVPIKSCKHGSFSLFSCHIRGANIVHIFTDSAMSESAIAMQHRAPQACKSCRKLKRKVSKFLTFFIRNLLSFVPQCVYNPTLGICNRCSETGKPCVYAEVNPTAAHDDSVAVVHHNISTTSTNAGARIRLVLLLRHSHPSVDASGHLDTSLQQGNALYLDTFGTGWVDEFGQPIVLVHFPFRLPVLTVQLK
jgi:hypothetical protein